MVQNVTIYIYSTEPVVLKTYRKLQLSSEFNRFLLIFKKLFLKSKFAKNIS